MEYTEETELDLRSERGPNVKKLRSIIPRLAPLSLSLLHLRESYTRMRNAARLIVLNSHNNMFKS